MNDERSKKSKPTLDQRFASHPRTAARLHEIADMMDQTRLKGATVDEAEAMAVKEIRKLAQGILTDCAQAKHDVSVREAQSQDRSLIRHAKKK